MCRKATNITPIDKTLIPSGELRSVSRTPFDFRESIPVGVRIGLEGEQPNFGIGYDHNAQGLL